MAGLDVFLRVTFVKSLIQMNSFVVGDILKQIQVLDISKVP